MEQPVSITIGALWSLSRESSLLRAPDRMQPAITYVNRSIRVDSLKMYYKNNSFVGIFCSWWGCRDGEVILKWLEAIGEQNRRYVHDFTVLDDECFECLQDLKVEVQRMQGRMSSPMREYEFPTCKVTFAKME